MMLLFFPFLILVPPAILLDLTRFSSASVTGARSIKVTPHLQVLQNDRAANYIGDSGIGVYLYFFDILSVSFMIWISDAVDQRFSSAWLV
jgi:hypothetical protein